MWQEREVTTCSCGMILGSGPENPPEFALFHGLAGHRLMEGCGRQIGPYPCCSVIEGDCLELMKQLPDGCVELAFADPPYGIMKAEWDANYIGVERELLRIGMTAAVTPGQWALNQCVMSMREAYVGIISARNLNGMTFSPLGFGNWIPTVIGGSPLKGQDAFEFTVSGDKPNHPSPKPLEYMLRLVDRLTEVGDTILDPFCGSGTTLVAAKKLGRHYLGFEISPAYVAIARERIARVEAQPSLFQQKPEQLTIGDIGR